VTLTWPDDFVDKVIEGDCLEVMKEMPDGCVDAVVRALLTETYTRAWNFFEIARKRIPEARLQPQLPEITPDRGKGQLAL
jgi:hypothetical protein